MFSCRQIARTVSLLVLAALLIACGRPDMAAEPPADDGSGAQPPSNGVELEGTEWELTSLHGNPLIEGSHISLRFDGETAGGSAGCNSYGGEYTATADGSLSIPEISSTMMACETPVGIMEQEKTYVEALRNAASYQMLDDRLEIKNAAGETTLVFDQPDTALVDTEWELTSLRGNKPLDGSF